MFFQYLFVFQNHTESQPEISVNNIFTS